MISLHTIICESHDTLPSMRCDDFFHSETLFRIFEQTPRMKPYMVAVCTPDGRVVSHMLGVVRYRTSLFPPFLYIHCMVMGEGEYADSSLPRKELFKKMLLALTKKLQGRVLYIEFSHLHEKMFGYGCFRKCGYFPMHWLSIRNSLHSRTPEERLGSRPSKHIERARRKEVDTEEVADEAGLEEFARLLRKHNRLKPKRYIPDIAFFRQLMVTGTGKLFLTKYKGKAIGCCSCVFSGSDAYLWHTASLRKTYAMLHPSTVTVWQAIKYAHSHGYRHIIFMDVGLPFRKNPYREFILQFGGKPVSTYRWFRVSVRWINGLLSWIHRD